MADLSENRSSDLFSLTGEGATFPVYWDEKMTRQASLEEYMTAAVVNGEDGDIRFYTSWDFHRAHCLHVWRLIVSAAERMAKGEKNLAVYYEAASAGHVEHCSQIIMDGDNPERDEGPSFFKPSVGRCTSL
jgi:hypothetical protein